MISRETGGWHDMDGPRPRAHEARRQLLELIRTEAVIRGQFVLSSGRESPYYVDARRVTLSARGSRLVGRVIWSLIEQDGFDAVGGLTLGADPVVSAVSLSSAESARPVDGLLVRKAPKEHGTGRRVEGPLREGMRVLVVEDTSTTGGSALEAVQALTAEGVRVDTVVTLIDREEGARAAVEAEGLRFEAVFTISEILAEPEEPNIPPPSSGGLRLLLHADGSAVGNPGPAGAGFVLFNEQLEEVRRGSDWLGTATNNVAEYEALIRGMEMALEEGADDLTVRMDSTLIVNQMNGAWKVKHQNLQGLHVQAQALARRFRKITYEYVPRTRNRLADKLATEASARGK